MLEKLLLAVILIFSVTGIKGNLLVITNGSYYFGPDGQDYWLTSGPFFAHHGGQKLDTRSGSLKIQNVSYGTSGIDILGNWQESMNILEAPGVHMEVAVRTYPLDQPDIIIFAQRFPEGLNMSSAPSINTTCTGFPTILLQQQSANTSLLAYLMFAGYMAGDRSKVYGRWNAKASSMLPGGLDGSGPLVLFDHSGNVVIMSPMNHFMAASISVEDGVLAWGVMGGVDNLPPGFELSTLVYIGSQGIGQAFYKWGLILREYYGKTDDVVRYHQNQDLTLTHLGYWTDNGAYYYYHTEAAKTYEQTLSDIVQDAIQHDLPYRYIQLDSWWYPKDNISAVTTWDAKQSIFPHGLRNLSEHLNLTFAAHNRFWSVNTTYAKQHGGSFDFFIGNRLSLPLTQDFWDNLFDTARQWGLILYEQDWLNVQTLETELLHTNLTAGASWLNNMANAAGNHGLKIQYCMSQSRHALHSLLWPEVTQIRVTDDYHLYKNNWKIGITSHFATALGLAPSKDTFWTRSQQPGNPYNLTEPMPELQSAIATLSTGPVGPGDAINMTDKDTLMRCCSQDGLALKPSRPITAIDAVFLEMGFGEGGGVGGEIWSTYTDINEYHRFGIIFATNLSRSFNITPINVGLSPLSIPWFPESRIFARDFPEKLYNFNRTSSFEISSSDCNLNKSPFFCLFYTSPVIHLRDKTEVVIIGELSKWVPISTRRVLSLNVFPASIQIDVRGKPGELITFLYTFNGLLSNISVEADHGGCATINISSATQSSSGFPVTRKDKSCAFRPPPFTTPPSFTTQPSVTESLPAASTTTKKPVSVSTTPNPQTTSNPGGSRRQSHQSWISVLSAAAFVVVFITLTLSLSQL